MKFKFYTGIAISIIVGFFVAAGVLQTGTVAFKYIQSAGYALYESVGDLGSSEEYGIEEKKVEETDPVKDLLESRYYFYENSDNFPRITSRAYLVADLDTGKIIKQSNRDKKYPIASLTKLMTALVSVETVNQDGDARVSYDAINTYGRQGNLYSGQVLKASDFLYPLLLESSNDASEVIAEFSGRKFFLANMNGKARSVGLVNTSFGDPSGLSYENISTVEDLFKLVQYIYKNEAKILEITKQKNQEIDDNVWFSNSRFRNDERYYGGKNGYTDEALHTLISIFDLPLGESEGLIDDITEDRRIAIILLKGDETEDDTRDIISWLLNNIYYQ